MRPTKAAAWITALGIATLAGLTPAVAEMLRYTLDIPSRERVAYQIEIPVEHAGELVVDAEWSAARILSFRLDPPGHGSRSVRRSGPSPQRLEVPVAPDRREVWTLHILGLAARDSGRGLLTVHLPDSPEVVRRRLEAMKPPPPPEPEPEPWMVPRENLRGASPDRVELVAHVERFRSHVVLPGWKTAPDACRWQAPLLEYLAQWRDEVLDGDRLPDVSTSRWLRRLAETSEQVEDLRTSRDPKLAGPPPTDSIELREWNASRRMVVRPLERDLDQILVLLKDGHAPMLETEVWPQRLVSCIMACERHFEASARVGAENALNRDLAVSQWPVIRAATRALESLSALSAKVPE